MTHPLVSAFHNIARIERSLSKVTTKEHERQLARALLNNYDVANEVMASTPMVKCFVGILCGFNNRPYLIWLWPLSEIAEYHYWTADGWYYREDGWEQCAVRVELPHFLRD